MVPDISNNPEVVVAIRGTIEGAVSDAITMTANLQELASLAHVHRIESVRYYFVQLAEGYTKVCVNLARALERGRVIDQDGRDPLVDLAHQKLFFLRIAHQQVMERSG